MNRLRWKLSLIWGKPYDDPYWLSIHTNKWRVYAEHYKLDLEEEMEAKRQYAEYIMSFHNVDGVRAVQRARDLQKRNADKEVGDVFAQQVEGLFGRKLTFDELAEARKSSGSDKPTYVPDPEELQQQMQEVREKAIIKEPDTLVVTKPKVNNEDIGPEEHRFRHVRQQRKAQEVKADKKDK